MKNNNFDRNRAFEDLKQKLREKRFKHSLAVADCSKDLAKIHGENIEKAYIAGLFHDFAKELSNDESLKYLNEMKEVDEFLLKTPNLAHGKIAAYILQKEYNLKDAEILSAISKHTFGDIDMTALDKIVYIADAIEPNRNYENCQKIRDLAYKDLDLSCIEYLKNNFVFLSQNNKKIHTKSVEMYNKMIEEYRKE